MALAYNYATKGYFLAQFPGGGGGVSAKIAMRKHSVKRKTNDLLK